jgi:pyruvate/2-oxoglutarate dehydrogenase complex dihydrolipoamide acyltransferase (E2) component
MGTQVIMPQLGESVVEGKVSRWLKQVGDHVDLYEPILEVETDKVTTEVTAAGAGTLLKLYFNEGDVVKAGTPIAFIGEPGETPPDGDQVTTRAASAAAGAAAGHQGNGRGARISPVVARIAGENSIDVSQVPGTGEGGRVTKKDILAYVEKQKRVTARPPGESVGEKTGQRLEPWEQPGLGELFRPTEEVFNAPSAPTKTPPPAAPAAAPTSASTPAASPGVAGETVPLTGIRKAIADHMVLSKRTSPHVTTVFEVDLSKVVAHRSTHKADFERDGVNLTFTPYFAMATIAALKQHPWVNSSWSEDGIVLHRSINLGIAVSLSAEGLIVPVIKDADSLNLLGLARAVNDLADRARRKQLKPDEVQGGTFTVTNHGTSGSLFATPIINQPQCGILGVGLIQKRVVVVTQDGVDSIAIKPMAYVGLTFDHRILDGNSADNFVAALKQTLENWA